MKGVNDPDKQIREELYEKLELFKPRQETWRGRHLAGVEAPLLRLVARYEAEGNLRMAATVQSMGAYESCKTLTERLGSKYIIHMLRRNAHKELNKVYGCRRERTAILFLAGKQSPARDFAYTLTP